MGRVLIRDQYEAEHWVDEGQLAYDPWRDCEVIGHESAVETPAVEQVPAPEPPADDKPAKPQPRKTAAE